MEWRAGRRSEDAVSPSMPQRSGATLRGLGGRGSSGERGGMECQRSGLVCRSKSGKKSC